MSRMYKLSGTEPVAAVRSFLAGLLSEKLVDAVFVASGTPYSQVPMPAVITDPEKLENANPLAPAAPFNAARQASALLRQDIGKKAALVLRPCEIRALVELAKLRQCVLDNAVIIGIECLGRLENDDFLKQIVDDPEFVQKFHKNPELRENITGACKACGHFSPLGADISICVIGLPENQPVCVSAETENGNDILKTMGLQRSESAGNRDEEISDLRNKRKMEQDALIERTAKQISQIDSFQKMIATCLNCYNCRMACPVCYCRECVFLTDVFAHEPEILFRRAGKKGGIKLPSDTVMFHMTRLAHMSHACVGCGQCASVCPSNIPVADIFKTVAARTRELFDYEPGRDASEPIPYLAFEKE